MISISTSGLAYRIGTKDILTDVTFSLEDGDKLAVVGVNGSGKSTLLRLICGEYTPDEGSVYFAKNKNIFKRKASVFRTRNTEADFRSLFPIFL